MQDKKLLYRQLQKKLDFYGITKDWYPLKAVDIVKRTPNFYLKYHKFKSEHIGAALIKSEPSGILVNSNKPLIDQNFDIMHELVHYWLHPVISSFSFDKTSISQNPNYEWEANEGAAQLLVPYQDFIPKFLNVAKTVEDDNLTINDLYSTLAKYYKVNEIVIDYRIQNLDTEIMQYHFGASMQNIALNTDVKHLDRSKKTRSVTKEFLNRLKRQEMPERYRAH